MPDDKYQKPSTPQHIQVGSERFALLRGPRHERSRGLDHLYVQPWAGDEPLPVYDLQDLRIELISGHRVGSKSGCVQGQVTMNVYADDCEVSLPRPATDLAEESSTPWVHIFQRHDRSIENLMHWWLANSHRFFEHPVRLWRASERRALEGRKIYYREQPAIILGWHPLSDLHIAPDPRWERVPLYSRDLAYEFDATSPVRVEFLSEHIDWHRDVA